MHGCVRSALVAVGCCATTASLLGPVASSAEPPPAAKIANSPDRGYTYASALQGHSIAVSLRPGAKPYKHLPARTEMGTKRHLPIVKVRDDWLAVMPTMKRNGKKVWIKRSTDDVRFVHTPYSVRVDLSRRTLELRQGAQLVRRTHVAVGRPGSSTPTGRFAITDKLNGRALSGYYGCCVLALNGHQPNLPAGWKSGNRLAIHGTNDPSSIGKAASAGCVRARDRDLRLLMKRLPPGAPVFVRR